MVSPSFGAEIPFSLFTAHLYIFKSLCYNYYGKISHEEDETMNGALAHFLTITKHRHAVIRNCWYAGIFWQGLRHDLSKYSPEEFIAGARHYQGTRSPNEGERDDYGFSYAWMHH